MSDKADGNVSDAAARLHNWVSEFVTLGGVDPEVAHRANYAELRISDLRLLLSAVDSSTREEP